MEITVSTHFVVNVLSSLTDPPLFHTHRSNQETQILRIVLHSTAAPIQAQIAMQQTNRNIRKIILATNIAESSITVPDVKYGASLRNHFGGFLEFICFVRFQFQ